MDIDNQQIIVTVFSKLDRLLDQYVDRRPEDVDLQSRQAFLWHGRTRSLKAVRKPVRIDPVDLVGIDEQKQRVMENTRRFVQGGMANNVLLWGERGTGKSSLVKSLLTVFSGTPLRMVQVLKHDILTIQDLSDYIAGHLSFRFILFIDDLSFEESQTDYKEMKTILDGGLEQMPDNVLFYATSNRKHLIPTKFSDSETDETRPADTIEEKVSLADRFGIRLGFYHISQETYLDIVDLYAKKYGITLRGQDIHRQAIRWSLEAGGRNGRIAEQFVRSLSS